MQENFAIMHFDKVGDQMPKQQNRLGAYGFLNYEQ